MISVIRYKDGYKYQLAATHHHKLSFRLNLKAEISTEYLTIRLDGTLIIKKGYAWDGASGPTYDSKSSMRGALVHDAIYQLMRMGLLDIKFRKKADLEMYKIMREDGMWYLRAKSWYFSVRVAAGFAAKPDARKKVLTAP